jgi:ribonuclease R
LKRRNDKNRGRHEKPRHPQKQGLSRSHASGAAPAQGRMAEGVVSANRAGFGFVRIEGQEEAVFLPPPQMAGVMHGDRVRVSVERGRDGRYSGRLEKILEHATKAFVGTLEVHGRTAFVTSADRRIGMRCLVPPEELNGARHGDWVIAAMTRYAGSGSTPQARIVKRLDPEKPVELACEAAIARFDLPQEFSPEAVREAEAYGREVDANEAARRVDLRNLPLVTIDGDDAKDFDDAVFCEPHAKGFRLIVAIADVSYYVRRGTALDASARERGTSVYFPTRVIPMLPFALSNVLCSLQPKVDRLCFAADMIVSKTGVLLDATFYPAVMRSAARLTYTQAFAALIEGKPDARAELGGLTDKLLPLVDVYHALLKARHKRGALEFDAAEAEFDIDEVGRIQRVYMYERNEAHKLIEECMILANVAVARELESRHIGTLYRVHGRPEQRKLDLLLETLNALGIAAEFPDEVSPRDFRAITDRLGHDEQRPFIESLIVRSMMQAVYQPQNIGHFGLALKHYAHFTSPIRRYPDLIAHRGLLSVIGAGEEAPNSKDVAEAGPYASERERDASLLERDADSVCESFLLQRELFDAGPGAPFVGVVSGVIGAGAFVRFRGELADVYEGFLPARRIGGRERYELDESETMLLGLRGGPAIRLGDPVTVSVDRVDAPRGRGDLLPVSKEQG